MFTFMRQSYPLLKRSFSTVDNTLLAHCLEEKSLLKLSGKDACLYMQGLMTNDMSHLEGGSSSMFTMFLNSKGRVMYDSIIYNTNIENTYFIECDSAASSDLKDHLLRYKVRRKINVDLISDEFNIWVIAKSNYLENIENAFDYKKIGNSIKQKLSQILITGDPRLPSMGLRIIAPKDLNVCKEIKKMTDIETREENFYKLLRYKLGIGEGIQELPFEKCFPMEINGDYLHGISFHKGCYVGQELTARTYHTGVIRKRLMPLSFQEELKVYEHGIPIFAASHTNKSIGKLYGIEQTSGIGLLRIEEALNADELMISNNKGTTHRPFWWPTEASKTKVKTG